MQEKAAHPQGVSRQIIRCIVVTRSERLRRLDDAGCELPWVVNVLPDIISEMTDEDVDCFSELFTEEQEAREAARLRDEGVLEPADDVEEAFPGEEEESDEVVEQGA